MEKGFSSLLGNQVTERQEKRTVEAVSNALADIFTREVAKEEIKCKSEMEIYSEILQKALNTVEDSTSICKTIIQ